MPTIRIDQDVYIWLKSQAEPFEDTPNSVLRRLAGLEKAKSLIEEKSPILESIEKKGENGKMQNNIAPSIRGRRISGEDLNRQWNVNAKHALYHQDGTFYENLNRFPGALFDPKGYILFKTELDYDNSPYLDIGKRLNVRQGISSIPGYKRMK
jgi:hypothetical protein